MLLEIRQKMPDFKFQQDGTPAHTAWQTVALLKDNCPAFIKPESWPSYSPNLNPIDYFIWSAMKQKVRDIAHLKSKIIQSWEELLAFDHEINFEMKREGASCC